MKHYLNPGENSGLETALCEWHNALKRFDSAEGDEVRCAALEVEAAKQRYILLLNKQRGENEARRIPAL